MVRVADTWRRLVLAHLAALGIVPADGGSGGPTPGIWWRQEVPSACPSPVGGSGYSPLIVPPESIRDNQRSRIMRHLGRLSKAERAERLRNLVGRDDIESTNDLSWAEAAEVIKVLEA